MTGGRLLLSMELCVSFFPSCRAFFFLFFLMGTAEEGRVSNWVFLFLVVGGRVLKGLLLSGVRESIWWWWW